jgi:rhamnose utilization protein RhaD (predicted bifunctional aldolase and dehydrogenase)/NAD(P)-dependent dehydrogenase (short-subunit alcohol dehydrogenase family)
MKSAWNDAEAQQLEGDLLKLRVYTSRLLGRDPDLVLHGGGNTSVKIHEKNIFGEEEEILYVKGSGWDLATIEEPGFAPVKMEPLKRLAQLEELSDMEMVRNCRMAMTNPAAPNPSVEAILHGLIPYTFVDHTHADAVVTITNTPNGEELIKEIYGDKIMIIPYVMPGFILAKTIHQMTQGLDWDSIDGMILLKHGVFTFHDDPKVAYEKMIDIVSKAEDYLAEQQAVSLQGTERGELNMLDLARLRREISGIWGKPVLARLDDSGPSVAFSQLPNVHDIANRGNLAPEHVIRIKRTPVILGEDHQADIDQFVRNYQAYYEEFNRGETLLNPAPCWAIWPGIGTVSFGPTPKHLRITEDVSQHTTDAIVKAEKLGGFVPLSPADLFDMEYWSLEQAKLKKKGSTPTFQGKVALVTGAMGGIGKACVESLVDAGAVVAALDIDPGINERFSQNQILGLQCDVTDTNQLTQAIAKAVAHFGGLDLLITNAGIFPKSASIADMDEGLWQKSMDVNLSSHQKLLQLCIPYLEQGFDPAVVIIASKNVPAPGPGASAYSVAKAGLTQLGRVAALELGAKGIRVNMIHPNAVYDTGIWTEDILQARAKHYGLTVEQYKTNNVLHQEVTSRDVGDLAVSMLGPTFAKITGAQVPIDGGNDRVI